MFCSNPQNRHFPSPEPPLAYCHNALSRHTDTRTHTHTQTHIRIPPACRASTRAIPLGGKLSIVSAARIIHIGCFAGTRPRGECQDDRRRRQNRQTACSRILSPPPPLPSAHPAAPRRHYLFCMCCALHSVHI